MSKLGFSRFRTSRGRLLAILLAVLTPIAGLMAAAAWTNYKFTAASIDRDYALLTSNYEGRVRVWIHGMERAMVAAVSGVATLADNDQECGQAVRRIVSGTIGFKALHVALANGHGCFYSAAPAMSEARVAGYGQAAVERGIMLIPAAGMRMSEARLFFSQESDMRDVVFVARSTAGDGIQGWKATLLVDSEVLANVISLGEPYQGAQVALIQPNRHVVASRGLRAGVSQWLPQAEIPADAHRWLGTGVDGQTRIYAFRPVLGRELSILAGFDAGEMERARLNFLFLLGMPFLVLASLTAAFVRASDLYILRWLRRLEATARARSQLREVRVAISPSMPTEIRNFSIAFNDMAEAEETRRAALQEALDRNQFLVRELHHRVKNSLQVIQSYMAIERRSKLGEARDALLDAELRVHILSIAYRIALADGVIRPVNLGDFLGQMIPVVVSNAFQNAQQAIVEPMAEPMMLDLEKVVALGFLTADALLRAAKAGPQFCIRLILTDAGGLQSLSLVADRPLNLGEEPRMNRGLTAQLGATPVNGCPGDVVAGWRWRS